jgi:hypothetical protein
VLSADKCAAEAPSISQLSGYRLRIKTHAAPRTCQIASAFSSSPVAPRFKRARLVIAVILTRAAGDTERREAAELGPARKLEYLDRRDLDDYRIVRVRN